MPEFRSRIGELVTSLGDVGVQNIAAAEMRQMAAFIRSSVGMKSTGKLPLMFQESRQVGADWGRRVALDALQKNAQKRRDMGIKL